MKKRILLIIITSFFLGGCSLSPKRSAIEINSYPVAKVFLDGKEMGMTPYKNRSLRPGEIEVKLKTNDSVWIKKVKLQNNVNTVIDWEFGKNDEESGGYILFLEKTGDKKNAGLMTISNPSTATISIDNEIKGFSPIKINNIGEGDKHLTLTFPGHKNADIFVKAIKGYQLVVEVILAKETTTINEENKNQEDTPKIENSDLVENQTKVTIKETETGWLRVREEPLTNAKEIARVNPKESYVLLEEKTDWFKIELENGNSGWISSNYAEKN
ncbi:MAG: PEGA domain-containing protein [Candidatus Shapirobacteria bacterium]|nr:PEGA domain-containing protein [Candidatus Shapirobacteria bacterium]